MPIMKQDKKSKEICPICDTALLDSGIAYTLNELFELWEPVKFSPETIEEHTRQSDHTRLYTCPDCGLDIFLPQIIGTSKFYLDLLKPESKEYYVDEKWEFEEALKDAKNMDKVIEIGCGSGSFLEKIKPHVSKICGTEFNGHALKIARDKGLEVFKTDDEIKRGNEKYDGAFSFHVLEHVADPVNFLSGLGSLVKVGGKIGVSVPNSEGPLRYVVPCIEDMPPHHSTRWRLKTFKAVADRLGYKIERVMCEPLFEHNYYYYSIYWVDHMFPENFLFGKKFHKRIHRIASYAFQSFFRLLSIFDKKCTTLLNGQAIYILMSK